MKNYEKIWIYSILRNYLKNELILFVQNDEKIERNIRQEIGKEDFLWTKEIIGV